MPRQTHLLVVAALALAGAGAEAADLRFSGQIALVDPGGATILVEELGPSAGTSPTVIQRSVSVGPETSIQVVERSNRSDGLPGAFTESAATAGDLKPGDFVTVTARRRDGQLHAATVSIIRPDRGR